MAIILRDLRMNGTGNCEITVNVGDHLDQGLVANLKIEIEGHPTLEKEVNLYYPPRKVSFPVTPRDGRVHTVKAILTANGNIKNQTRPLLFCNV